MRSFNEIQTIAAERHGGEDSLREKIETGHSRPLSPAALAQLPESHWLETFTRCIFQAGFSWKVIDAKWDGFREVFDGFDVGRCAFMDDENLMLPCVTQGSYATVQKLRRSATMPLSCWNCATKAVPERCSAAGPPKITSPCWRC